MTVLEIAEKVKEKYNLESRDEELENLKEEINALKACKEEINILKDCIREYDEILVNITKLIDMLGKNVYSDNKYY